MLKFPYSEPSSTHTKLRPNVPNKEDFFLIWYIGSQTKQTMRFQDLPELPNLYLKGLSDLVWVQNNIFENVLPKYFQVQFLNGQ